MFPSPLFFFLEVKVPAQMLRNMPDAPQLPACYPAMMILALCPPLFHRIMDPRVARLLRLQPPHSVIVLAEVTYCGAFRAMGHPCAQI